MKLCCLAAALVLLFAFNAAGRADEFSDIEKSPNTYWVPAPSGYGATPGPYPYYGGPPPVYYYGPPPVPGFFIHFHFH
jgi:hypothetical protein